MRDLSPSIRATLIATLEADAGFTAIVPASRIYPSTTPASPALPFVRFETMDVSPYEDSCGDGCEVEMKIHVWANSEGQAEEINSMLVSIIDKHDGFVSCDWLRTGLTYDYPAVDVFHGMVTFTITKTE